MKFAFLYFVFMLCFWASSLQAQTLGIVSSATVESDIKKQQFLNRVNAALAREQSPADKAETFALAPEKVVDDETYNPKFFLNEILLEGNTVYADSELLTLALNLLKKEVHLSDLINLAAGISKQYYFDGYVTSFAYLPEQDVIGGKVKIVIVESRIFDIALSGNRWANNTFFDWQIFAPAKLERGNIFNVKELDVALRNLNQTGYIKSDVQVTRNDNLQTVIDMQIVDRMPLFATAGYDNLGRKIVGKKRFLINLADDNLLGFGDKIYFGAVLASRSNGYLAGYSVPILPFGTKFAVDYAYSDVSLGGALAPFAIAGKSYTVAPKIEQLLYEDSELTLSADLGLNLSHTTSASNSLGVSLTDYRLSALRSNMWALADDDFGRTFASLGASLGLNAFNAAKQTAGAPKTAFFKTDFHLTRLQKVPLPDSFAVLRLEAQYSPDMLYPLEQMQIGGANSVRGYEQGLLIGDYGVSGTFELRTPIPYLRLLLKEHSSRLKLLTFYDFGYVKEHHKIYQYKTNFLQSLGFGFAASLPLGIEATLTAGFPVGNRVYADDDVRFDFNVAVSLDQWLYKDF